MQNRTHAAGGNTGGEKDVARIPGRNPGTGKEKDAARNTGRNPGKADIAAPSKGATSALATALASLTASRSRAKVMRLALATGFRFSTCVA